MSPYDKLDKYIRLNIWILRVLGAWPKNDKFSLTLYSIYGIFILTMFVKLNIIFSVIKLFTIYDNLAEFSSAIFIAFSEVMCVIKFYFVMYKLPTIKKLIRKVTSDAFQPKSEKERKIAERNVLSWKKMYAGFIWVAYFTIILWTLYPILDKEERQLPFNVWYPYNYKLSPFYELTYFHQFVMIFLVVGISLNVDTLTAMLMLQVALQCEILAHNLEHIHEFTKNRLEKSKELPLEDIAGREANKSLIICIKHHKEILSFANDLNNVCGLYAFLQFGTSALTLCMSLFLVSVLTPGTAEFYSELSFTLGVLTELFAYCWFGNEVILKSSQVCHAAYNSQWTDFPAEFKKNLVYFIQRTQQPIYIYAINFFPLSIETFMGILRMGWSYFSILHNKYGGK